MARARPTASELLSAIADLLREEVTPVLDKADPRLGFQMRVAAHSPALLQRRARRFGFEMRVAATALASLEREARLGPAADARERERLVKLLGHDGTLDD